MSKENPKTVLILTSSGGGGLLQAAEAKRQQIHSENIHAEVITIDVFRKWTWKWMGYSFVSLYNWTQKEGKVFLQTLLVHGLKVADKIMWPFIFLGTLRMVFRHDVDRIIDTQIFAPSAVLFAIRLFHLYRKKEIGYEKIIVDLPTKKSLHFFNNIKKLSKKNKNHVSIVTIEPLEDGYSSEEEFWLDNCGLEQNQVRYEKYPIRKSFLRYMDQEYPKGEFSFFLEVQEPSQADIMQRIFNRGPIGFSRLQEGFDFRIAPDDKLLVVLLGSQPAKKATKKYVDYFLQLAEQHPNDKKAHLFVFCSAFSMLKNPLFSEVAQIVLERKYYPKNVSVIPFTFQKDDVIASLFYRSNATITRSGGQTAMELMAVGKGKMWIHSELKNREKETDLNDLLSGIPHWEAGNALYLVKKRGAQIITPELFLSCHGQKLLGI